MPTYVDGSAGPRAKLQFPRPINIAAASVNMAAEATTSGHVFLGHLDEDMLVDKLTYNVGVAGGNADNILRFAVYSEDGQKKYIDETDAVGTATGARAITLTADVFLPAGYYYFFVCMSSGTGTGPQVTGFQSLNIHVAGASGEPDIGGLLSITAGAAPTTFDPTAITTPGDDVLPAIRLDGA